MKRNPIYHFAVSLSPLLVMSLIRTFPVAAAFSRPSSSSRRLTEASRGTRRYYGNMSGNDNNPSGASQASDFPPTSHSLRHGRLKHRLRNGLPLTGVVSGQYRDTDHVELLGLMGYDFLWADCEHSSGSPDHVLNMIVAAERRGMPTLVRIGYGYHRIIGHAQKFLVAGAQGILLPQCESKADVETVVEAVKFPPVGRRGLAGERWNAWGIAEDEDGRSLSIAECVADANRNTVVGVLVETQRGLNALEEIVTVPELDLIFIAPTDLSADMGLHGQIRHPDVLQKVEEIVQAIQQYNEDRVKDGLHAIATGTLAVSADDYIYWRERNVQVMCGVAQCMFVDGAKTFMDKAQEYEGKRQRD